jgi:hypothetical protein
MKELGIQDTPTESPAEIQHFLDWTEKKDVSADLKRQPEIAKSDHRQPDDPNKADKQKANLDKKAANDKKNKDLIPDNNQGPKIDRQPSPNLVPFSKNPFPFKSPEQKVKPEVDQNTPIDGSDLGHVRVKGHGLPGISGRPNNLSKQLEKLPSNQKKSLVKHNPKPSDPVLSSNNLAANDKQPVAQPAFQPRAGFRPIVETEGEAIMPPRISEPQIVRKSGNSSALPLLNHNNGDLRKSINKEKTPPIVNRKVDSSYSCKSRDRLVSAKESHNKPIAKDSDRMNIFNAAKANELAKAPRIVSAVKKPPIQKPSGADKEDIRPPINVHKKSEAAKSLGEKKQVVAKRERDIEIRMVHDLPDGSSTSSESLRGSTNRQAADISLFQKKHEEFKKSLGANPEVVSKKPRASSGIVKTVETEACRKDRPKNPAEADRPEFKAETEAKNTEKGVSFGNEAKMVFEYEDVDEGDNAFHSPPKRSVNPAFHLPKLELPDAADALGTNSNRNSVILSTPDPRLKPAIKSPLKPPKDISSLKTDSSGQVMFPFDYEYDDMDPESLV